MKNSTPQWMQTALRLAAIYNLVWGTWVILAPEASLRISGYPLPLEYPPLWQCLGMVIGVYGIGYWIAAADPVRHWAVVFVGLLGKVLGPIGFLWAYWQGSLPFSAGQLCLLNDIIWWIPFGLILAYALKKELTASADAAEKLPLDVAIQEIRSNQGQTLAELSASRPVLLVFLRHAGCTFCREALSDLSKLQPRLAEARTGLAFVHMSTPERADDLFAEYGLEKFPRFSDPAQVLYQAFDLKNGTFHQLLGPQVFLEGVRAGLFRGHGVGIMDGNGLRLPGVFLLKEGKVIAANPLRTAAERPDYLQIACPIS